MHSNPLQHLLIASISIHPRIVRLGSKLKAFNIGSQSRVHGDSRLGIVGTLDRSVRVVVVREAVEVIGGHRSGVGASAAVVFVGLEALGGLIALGLSVAANRGGDAAQTGELGEETEDG